MAQKLFSKDVLTLTKEAAEALGAYKFVKPNASDSAKADLCDTVGEQVLGVVDAAWDSGDEAVKINYAGIVYVKAGGTVAVGDYVCTDASGYAIKASGLVSPDYIAGVAMTAGDSGDMISIKLCPEAGASIASVGAAAKTLVIPLPIVAAATENDTGISLPAKCVVTGAFLDVTTAEATGGTKTLDVGTDGSGSNDPDGFMDGISAAAIGVIVPTLASGAQTLGVLLSVDEDGAGALSPEPDGTSGGESITYTLGSDDWAEFVGNLVLSFIEIQ